MSEWQQIDTPPPDGAVVLGYWFNGEMHTGLMCDGEWLPAWDHQDKEWGIPAYWMPLPAPPKYTVKEALAAVRRDLPSP